MTPAQTSHALFVSPHLDDAVFSCGGLIAQLVHAGIRCTVLTVLSGTVAHPTGFALRCQTDKGIDPAVDYMALRRAEDEAACQLLGAAAVHLWHLEAPHRGYESPAALFGAVCADDDAEAAIACSLEEILAKATPDIVFAPYGLGEHVDHLIVRAAVECLTKPVLWQDEPYAQKQRLSLSDSVSIALSDDIYTRKCEAIACYATQLDFQFGGLDRIAGLMPKHERFMDTDKQLARLWEYTLSDAA